MGEIRLRHVVNERDALEAELEELRRLRDAHQLVANDAQRELSEAKMTQEMYQVHNEALTIHLQSLGGNPNNPLLQTMKGLFREVGRITNIGSKPTGMASLGSNRTSDGWNNNADMPGNSIIQTQLRQQQKRQQQLQSEKRNLSISMILKLQSDKYQSDKNSAVSHPQVGGVILGNDSGHGGSDHFLRKLPTIFKMGPNNSHSDVILFNGSNGDDKNMQGYVRGGHGEVEFSSDSPSISAISAITIDEDAWTESESEDPD